jgi:hypothetical protein
VPFSSASFWQGLGFAVQKSLVHGQSLFSGGAAPGGMAVLWAQVEHWNYYVTASAFL